MQFMLELCYTFLQTGVQTGATSQDDSDQARCSQNVRNRGACAMGTVALRGANARNANPERKPHDGRIAGIGHVLHCEWEERQWLPFRGPRTRPLGFAGMAAK